jgi:protein HIRA/HIR1
MAPRSWDGMTLYAASSDGTLGVFDFTREELEGIAPHSVQEQYLSKFGFTPPPLPDGYSHDTKGLDPAAAHSLEQAQQQQQPQPLTVKRKHTEEPQGEKVNVLVAKKKKRVNLAGAPGSISAPGPRPPASGVGSSSTAGINGSSMNRVGSASSLGFFPGPEEQPFADRPPVSRKGKEVDFSGVFGGDMDSKPPPLSRHWSGSGGDVLPRIKQQSSLKASAPDSDDVLEATNPSSSGMSCFILCNRTATDSL